jgi:hypothetical protein
VAIARYGVARVGLVALLAGLLVVVGVPFLVALMVALVVALPLSLLLFPRLRRDLDAALAEHGRRRREQKESLRAQLRGEEAGSAERQREADPGGDRPGQHDQGGVTEHRDQVPAPDTGEHPPHR